MPVSAEKDWSAGRAPAITSLPQVAAFLPTVSLQHGERQDHRGGAGWSSHLVSQGNEIRGYARVAIRRIAIQFLSFLRHRSLFGLVRAERGKGRIGDIRVATFVVCGPRKRGIHDNQITLPRRDVQSLGCLFLTSPCRPLRRGSAEKRLHHGILFEEIKRTKGIIARSLLAIRQRVQPGTSELRGGVCGCEHGCGQMDRHRHHVATHQRLQHHTCVQGLAVTSRLFVELDDSAICRRKQGPCATGEIGNNVLLDVLGIGPRTACLERDRSQESRRLRARVEGCQEFSVGDEALKNSTQQVMGAGKSGRD